MKEANHRTDRSYVLSIDSAYGKGKTHFLGLLEQKLRENHLVARVDAWVDDADGEPAIAVMAAIQTELEPYLSRSSKLKEKAAVATRNIGPLLLSMFMGSLTKAGSKYVGSEALEAMEDLLEVPDCSASAESDAIAAGAEEAVDEFGSKIAELADRRVRRAITEYQKRKQSRLLFKQSMADLLKHAASLKSAPNAPLIVIIDELDRCRPDYAIKVLEEIKHFFDVPGVAFVLAMYGDQLAHSVKAIYGSEFNSKEYLRRFSDRTYELREKSMDELVATRMAAYGLDAARLRHPSLIPSSDSAFPDSARLIAGLCNVLSLTVREVEAVMDGLRLFMSRWDHRTPVELIFLIPKLASVVRRGRASNGHGLITTQGHLPFSPSVVPKERNVRDLYTTFTACANQSIQDLAGGHWQQPNYAHKYLQEGFVDEYRNRSPLASADASELSVLSEYDARVELIDGLLDHSSS